jgi:hypothetical protein
MSLQNLIILKSGPWITIHKFNGQMIGSLKADEPGTHININGFHAISR